MLILMLNWFKQVSELTSFRELQNAIIGSLIVIGGLFLAIFTLVAHRMQNPTLAGYAAIGSLAFVFLILIFVIPPLARSASAEASQLNLPFEFSTGGAVYVSLLVVIGFAAWNTGNNLLFIILSVLLSAFFVSFMIGFLGLRKLDIKIRFPEVIYAGEPTALEVVLINRKRFVPTYSVIAEVRGTHREYSRYRPQFERVFGKTIGGALARASVAKYALDYFFRVPRGESVKNRIDHEFMRRGRFTIKDFELSTTFPFGLFRHRRRLSAQEAELVVFPPLEQGIDDFEGTSKAVKKQTAMHKGSGDELFGFRAYTRNDDPRLINWKATARAGTVTIRENTAEDTDRVLILFDSRLPESEEDKKRSLREKISMESGGRELTTTQTRFEKGVGIAASIVSRRFEAESEVAALIGSEQFEFGNGTDHYTRILREIAIIEPASIDLEIDQSSIELWINQLMEGGKFRIISISAVDGIPGVNPNISNLIEY